MDIIIIIIIIIIVIFIIWLSIGIAVPNHSLGDCFLYLVGVLCSGACRWFY